MSIELLSLPYVVGFGKGYKVRGGQKTNHLAKVVLVTKKIPASLLSPYDLIPAEIMGEPTDVVEVGVIRALQSRTDKWRPAPGGVSIGHFAITAGTLGAVVQDIATGSKLILSNNHVLANSNDAKIGDSILQPGPYDYGTQNDEIAKLIRFEPIKFGNAVGQSPLLQLIASFGNRLASIIGDPCRLIVECPEGGLNVVDAAIAYPIISTDLVDDILEIGPVHGTKLAELEMEVRKSGRTTGLTNGKIELLDATVQVSYGGGKAAIFEQQIVTSNMAAGGDSGSLLVGAKENLAVGLLFAGSDEVTIYNPIDRVLELLKVKL